MQKRTNLFARSLWLQYQNLADQDSREWTRQKPAGTPPPVGLTNVSDFLLGLFIVVFHTTYGPAQMARVLCRLDSPCQLHLEPWNCYWWPNSGGPGGSRATDVPPPEVAPTFPSRLPKCRRCHAAWRSGGEGPPSVIASKLVRRALREKYPSLPEEQRPACSIMRDSFSAHMVYA